MRLLAPLDIEKKVELEETLREEQQRLIEALLHATREIGRVASPTRLPRVVRKYPVETVLLTLAAGVYIGRMLRNRKRPDPAALDLSEIPQRTP